MFPSIGSSVFLREVWNMTIMGVAMELDISWITLGCIA